MANSYFKFQKFTVHHDRCAMKVGTDGVLIGAWAKAITTENIMDIGTGTGLIALMLAQRFSKAQITAIDIDPEAISQAKENIEKSPFSLQISVLLQDIKRIESSTLYDCIVCNPPFYTEDILPPNAARQMARNTSSLSFEALIRNVARILSPTGLFNVIIPNKSVAEFESISLIYGLYATHKCEVYTRENKSPKRTMISFSFIKPTNIICESLVIHNSSGQYTPEYEILTKDFYLPQTFTKE